MFRIGKRLIQPKGGRAAAHWIRQNHVEVLFFAHTQNQFDALKDVWASCTQTCRFFVTSSVVRAVGAPVEVFPTSLAAVAALGFAPLLLIRAARAKGYLRKSYKYAFDQYWLSFGIFLVWHLGLQNVRPRVLVVASDHDIHGGTLIEVARDLGIKLVYVQHASVTDNFPPLEMDYAFLEGEDALSKYHAAGKGRAQIYLTGMPKADGFRPVATEPDEPLSIGICFNMLDREVDLEQLLNAISALGHQHRMIVRPHPRMTTQQKERLRILASARAAAFSDPAEEPVGSFLGRLQIMIAGESSVHLEAALSGVEPVYYAPAFAGRDTYGYLRNGLIRYVVHDLGDIRDIVEGARPEFADLVRRSKPYVATVGTPYFRRSAALVAELIGELSRNACIDLSRWVTVERFSNAFRLRDDSCVTPRACS